VKPSKGEDIVVIIFLLAALVGGIWTWTSAPCGLWSLAKAGEMPARCLDIK
jgi:hypothetical protein